MILEDKELPEMPLFLFFFVHLLLGMQPTLKSSLFLSETSYRETEVLFASGFQLKIASELGMGYFFPL